MFLFTYLLIGGIRETIELNIAKTLVLAGKIRTEKVGIINEKINIILKNNYDAKINKKQKNKESKAFKNYSLLPPQNKFETYINFKESC